MSMRGGVVFANEWQLPVLLAATLGVAACGTIDETVPDSPVERLVFIEASISTHDGVRRELDRMREVVERTGGRVREVPVYAEFGDRDALREIRAQIVARYEAGELQGVLLVGEIPTAFVSFRENADLVRRQTTDWYYRAIYASWNDEDGDGAFESISGDLRALVPVGRVFAGTAELAGLTSADRIALGLANINDDAEGLGPAWTGALDYLDSTWGTLELSDGAVSGFTAATRDYDFIADPVCGVDETTALGFWEAASRGYELVHLFVHGSYNQLTFRVREFADETGSCGGEDRAGGTINSSDFGRDGFDLNGRITVFNACSVCRLGDWFGEGGPTPPIDSLCSPALNLSDGTVAVISASGSTQYTVLPEVSRLLAQGIGVGTAMNLAWNSTIAPGEFDYFHVNFPLSSYNIVGSPWAALAHPPLSSSMEPSSGYSSRRGITDSRDLGLAISHGISAAGAAAAVMFWQRNEELETAVNSFEVELRYSILGLASVRTVSRIRNKDELGRGAKTWATVFEFGALGHEVSEDYSFRVRPRFIDSNVGVWSDWCYVRGTSESICHD